MGRRFALAFSLLGCALSSLPHPSWRGAYRQHRPGHHGTHPGTGGEQSLVATDVSSPEPRGVPKVGYHRALAAEGILSLSPTLVVGSDEMGPNSTLDQLRRANVKVEVMATAPTLANLNERIDTLAHLLGDQAAGSKLKEEIAAQSDPGGAGEAEQAPQGRLPAAAQGSAHQHRRWQHHRQRPRHPGGRRQSGGWAPRLQARFHRIPHRAAT